MPGSTSARAGALADMTESPIAVMSRPRTARWADERAGAADRAACAREAAPTRSPVTICFSIPDACGGAVNMPQPAIPVPAAQDTASTAAARPARLFIRSMALLWLIAGFLATPRRVQTRSVMGGQRDQALPGRFGRGQAV